MRLFVLLLGIIISGCASDPTVGYSTQSLYAPQFRTVAVPMFENNTTSRQMEMMLTDALVKKIQSRTPYRVVDEMNADTLLTGTITDVELQPLNRSSVTGFDNEVLLRVTVNFEWMNLGTGTRIVGKRNFSADAIFVPSRPSSEPIEMGQFAAIEQLSSDIVDQMQAAW